MQEFNQYHDEQQNFYRKTKFYFSQADKNKNVTLKEILAFTSDSAVEDFHQRGITFDRLCQNNMAILVSRVSLHFHKMIKADDVVQLKTWEESAKGMLFMRRYEIQNENGEKLVSGVSGWIGVNLSNRRLMRATDFTMRPLPTITTECDCIECGKIHHPENMQKLSTRQIHYSDIDGNGHVNNSRYAELVMDSISQDLQSRDIKDFRINYVQEAVLDSVIDIYGSFDEASQTYIIIGKTGNIVNFEAEIKY